MQWTDDAIVLSLRPHGEHSVILEALTQAHGRHLGLVHGGRSPKRRAVLQPGNSVRLKWRARLSENLGTFSVELMRARAGTMFETRAALTGLNAFTAIAGAVLPEREPHAAAYEGAVALLDAIASSGFADWAPLFAHWELALLGELGFGLDRKHMSTLPPFLLASQMGRPSQAELLAGLQLTADFLERSVLAPHGKSLPEPRLNLSALAGRALAESA